MNLAVRASIIAALSTVLAAACGQSAKETRTAGGVPAGSLTLAQRAPIELTVIGTNDLHGHMEQLPLLGGFLDIVRMKEGEDHVLLVDAGDMFQGTLESNLGEGSAVVHAYDALHYDAVAFGNHEFDFGLVGPSATPKEANDDPRGAIRARASEAHFPFLMANVVDAATGKPPAWKNVQPGAIIVKQGVHVGIVGVTSIDTPRTTISVNFAGLGILPLAESITNEAKELRAKGADIIVVAAHAGGKCKNVKQPDQDGECDPNQEIMKVTSELAPGTVDVIVAGHTHAGMATKIGNVPVIESFANGRAFGRVDLTIDPNTHKVIASRVLPTQDVELPAKYEGVAVRPALEIAKTFADDVANAKARKEKRLGTVLADRIKRNHDHECALGNLFADLMLQSHPNANVALTNGGGLRADLPPGELTYGSLFESMPFDNHFAMLDVTGAALRHILLENATDDHGLLSVAGISVEVSCKNGNASVVMYRRGKSGERGAEVSDTDHISIVTSDFLALGGDKSGMSRAKAVIEDDLIRDALEKGLTGRGILREKDVLDPARPRWSLPTERPVHCTP